MDPLSVTLAAISLATAVKDMVELGRKIHDSFAKVSKNLHAARRVAEDIKEMLDDIRAFCDDYHDTLDKMEDFRLALQGLLEKFRSFEMTILPLIPHTAKIRRGISIRGWWNSNNGKIEESILDLQSDIVKMMRKYMMKSAMRTEVKLEAIHQETCRGLTSIKRDHEVLQVVRRDVSALRATVAATAITQCLCQSSAAAGDGFDRNIMMFAKSTPAASAPILRTPDLITEGLLATAYIKLQVNNIVMILEKISKLPTSGYTVEEFQPSLILEQTLMSTGRLQHHIVQQIMSIHDLLDTEHTQTISIYSGACALNKLSVGLETLNLDQEAILIGHWAIMLARSLVDGSVGEDPDAAALLALYLYNQSGRYLVAGDETRGLQAIQEAFTISEDLQIRYSGQSNLRILHSDILLQYADLVDNRRSIEMCVESIQILEEVFDAQAMTRSKSKSPEGMDLVVKPSSSFVQVLFSSAASAFSILGYARALQRLGSYLFTDGDPGTALDLQLLAIALCRKIISMHGKQYKVRLARALSSLLTGPAVDCLPAEERVNMSEECIQIFREMAEKNPPFYARKLINVLWVKARTLGELGLDDEAISTWEEAASMAEQIVQDSMLHAHILGRLSDHFRRLNRHDDAVRTGTLAVSIYRNESQGIRYLSLSWDLQQVGRYRESAEAARTSVVLFRCLLIRNPETWTCCLAAGLSDLSHCLAALGEQSEALVAYEESVNIVTSFVDSNPDACPNRAFGMYVAALANYPLISLILGDEQECLNVCSTATRILRRLSQVYPHNRDVTLTLLWAESCHAYNMLRIGHLQEALQYIGYWFDIWSSKPETLSESGIAAWHAVMAILKANVLDAQGCTKQALLTTQRAHKMVKFSVSTYQPSFFEMVDSMVHEARLRVNLGESEEALQVAEKALQLSRDNELKPIVDSLVLSLHAVAFSALSCRDYKRTIEAAQECCSIFARHEDLKSWQNSDSREQHIFIRPSIFGLLSFAQANLGRYSLAVEYAHYAIDASQGIGNMKLYISATTAEQLYMETRGYLASICLATDDLAQARQICEERRIYFSMRVARRMGDYRELVPILRTLGVLYCSEGHHEEGEAAAQELSQTMETLGRAFPSLQEQVQIRLRYQDKAPIFKVLGEMSQKLKCIHQKEVGLLSTI